MPKVQQESRLTFVKQTIFGSQSKAIYRCECGVEKELHINAVKRKRVRSCGCLQRENRRNAKTHGLSGHPIHRIWVCMKGRCYNKNSQDYEMYGGRGVVVCDEWRDDFMAFYNWAIQNGWQAGLQIDKDKKAIELGSDALIYSPERCQFVTPKINSNNRRSSRVITYLGKSKTLSEWADETGLSCHTIKARIDRLKWSVEDALHKPLSHKL